MASMRLTLINYIGKTAAYLVAACAIVSMACLPAVGATLATTPLAYNDGNGPDAGLWRGSVSIDVDPVMPGMMDDEVEAVVEYAVFPPGRFQQFLDDNGLGGTDPAPDNAIYAYQITSIAAANPGISSLSVGLDLGDTSNSVTSVSTGVAGEVAPTTSANQLTSAFWSFGTPLGPGELSSILVIASPSEPELDTMQLQSGLASPDPSPLVASITDGVGRFVEIPEPQSIVLAVGLVALCGAARRRKQA